jgi:polygalacturonase
VTVSDCIIQSGDDGITVRCAEGLLKEKAHHCEYISIQNCVIHAAICAFRLGVGTGNIRHVNISGITVSRSRDLLQFATSYEKSGCACMEDIRITNISAADTDRVLNLFASNGAYVRNVTMENIRCDATMMSCIRQNDGIVDNLRLRNVEIIAQDRYDLSNANHLKMRGNCIFSIKNATNVVLEDVRIRGDLAGIPDRTVFTGCENMIVRNCAFE